MNDASKAGHKIASGPDSSSATSTRRPRVRKTIKEKQP